MSAINPYTYPSPANKPPSTVGPGALEGRDTPIDQNAVEFNDPDPDGALPPHLNPSSATYKELNRETMEHGYSPRDSSKFDPSRNEYPRSFGVEPRAQFPQVHNQQSLNPNNRGSAYGHSPWGRPQFSGETTQSRATDEAKTQATSGAQSQAWNPYASTFSPPGGFNTYTGSYGSPGNFNAPAPRDSPQLPGLQPFGSNFSYGGVGDWSRGYNDFNKR